MKNTITLVCFCLVVVSSFAQAPPIAWQKCLGGATNEQLNAIQPTADGGYIGVGYTNSIDGDVTGNQGLNDAWVVKLSSTGTIEWQKAFGGTANDYGNSIKATPDGGYIMVGFTESNDGDVAGNHGGGDAWVVKLATTGALQWQKCLGGTCQELFNEIQTTADGGYSMVGTTCSSNGDVVGFHDVQDAWVVKLSTSGVLEWQKCLGGTNGDAGYSIQQTPDGGYVMAGVASSTNGDVAGNHGNWDAWVVKLTTTGSLVWQHCLGGSDSDWTAQIQNTAEGGFILLGYTSSTDGDVVGSHGDSDGWVTKLSSSGDLQWQKCLGGSASEYAFSIQNTADGGAILVLDTTSTDGDVTGNHGNLDVWLVKLSSTGTLEWQRCLGGTSADRAFSVQTTANDGYIVSGLTYSNDGDVSGNHGNSDVWVVKLGTDLTTATIRTQGLSLYPNPANTVVHIQPPLNGSFSKIVITDLSGKTVLEQTQNTNQVPLTGLASGLYTIKAFSEAEVFVAKLVKK